MKRVMVILMVLGIAALSQAGLGLGDVETFDSAEVANPVEYTSAPSPAPVDTWFSIGNGLSTEVMNIADAGLASYEGDGTNKIMRVGIGGHNLELRYVMDSVTLVAGQTYTMTYDVGAKDHTQPYTVYTAQLLGYDAEAGEMNLLASEYHDADADPSTWENEHEMTTHTLSYTATAEDEEMGLKLVMGFWHYWGGASTSRSANLYVDNVSVTAVPEPATMVLLGLGGLMLRRKK